MSKTKTKANEMTLVENNVDPKVRMKEVRTIVAKAMKNGRRIDLLGFKGDDIARSQIALQDLLDRERTRHTKARDHIIEYQNAFEGMGMLMGVISEDAMRRMASDSEAKIRMGQRLNQMNEHSEALEMQNVELLNQIEQLTADLEAAMNIVRIALNGSTNG